MRHITAAIYFSFGVLFYLMTLLDERVMYVPSFLPWISVIFIFIGALYVLADSRQKLMK